jgi:hypothetical protein
MCYFFTRVFPGTFLPFSSGLSYGCLKKENEGDPLVVSLASQNNNNNNNNRLINSTKILIALWNVDEI